MFLKFIFFVGLVSAGLLLSLMFSSPPSSVGAVGVLGVFFLGYVTILCLMTLLFWAGVLLIRKVARNTKMARKLASAQPQDVYYYSTVIALAPVIIISLKSVGGISFYGIILVLVFEVLGCVYVAKRTA